jgi:hypothetical protein
VIVAVKGGHEWWLRSPDPQLLLLVQGHPMFDHTCT